MKKPFLFSLFLLTFPFLLCACGSVSDESKSEEAHSQSQSVTESLSESESESENVNAGYDRATADFSLPVFTVPISENSYRMDNEPRILIVSDNHYGYFNGAGGYSDSERNEIMVDKLIELYESTDSFDCVIFNGDTVHNDGRVASSYNTGYEYEIALAEEWRDTYGSRLSDAGVRYFNIAASHDSLAGDQFNVVYGYPDNYVILIGTTAYICCNTYAGDRVENGTTAASIGGVLSQGHTQASDIPDDFYENLLLMLAHDYVTEAYVICHYPSGKTNIDALMTHPKVLAIVSGHTHDNNVKTYCGKPMLQTGHFSRADTRAVKEGKAFKAFTPVNKDSVQNNDYSVTGSPWQFRALEHVDNGYETYTESYLIFPEVTYPDGVKTDEGYYLEGFTQLYTEARPLFLGDTEVVDRSYWRVDVEN